MIDKDELHQRLVAYFNDFESNTRKSRQLCERDRDYADHKQWTDAEINELRKRKQPPTINNRIRKKMNFLRGYERTIRTDPKAYPRTPQHDNDASAITDALRYVADNSSFDNTRSCFWDNFIIEGTGGCEVIVSNDKQKEIQTHHIMWDRLFWDFHSRRADFLDAKYTGIVIWDDYDNILSQFPKAKEVVDACFTKEYDDTFDDKPNKWVDSSRKRVRICQCYFQYKGKWHLAFYTKAGFLTDVTESPYKDEYGQPTNAMILQSAYVDREGNRFGEPRFMIEQQDSINKRESKMLHFVSQRQTFSNKRAFPKGTRNMKMELAKADGNVELEGNAVFGQDFGIIPTGDMAQGQFQLLQEAKAELDQTSVSAFQGAVGEGMSGRAIIANQNGQQIEINPLADGKRDWERRVYRAWWNRVRQFWTSERWIRVTDDEKNVKFVGLNRQVTVAEALQEEMGQIPPGYENDPRLQMVSRVENPVSEIDVDIVLEDAPDIVTVQQEEFRNLVDLANVGIQFDKDVYIRASQLRNKQEILERLQGQTEEEQAAMAQAAEAQRELEQQLIAAEAEKDITQAQKNTAGALKERASAEQIMVETQQMTAGLR